ncbi:MAG TPA: benzoyl-CoA 2,3-epoxidase subunit BoxB, partial [Rubrivivax sp.]|nr:benzoyl-CoA 2,3-epoxidase subunit BoxB [Rubrivivax sp.]
MAELDLPAPECGRRQGRAQGLRQRPEGRLRLAPRVGRPTPSRCAARTGWRAATETSPPRTSETTMSSINYSEKIPNNVNLSEDRTLQRALEHWQPNYLSWWQDMGPEGSQDFDVYLRTAVSVDPQGWAQFGHVKMPDYRWGIFLNPA